MLKPNRILNYGTQSIDQADIDAVTQVLMSDQITGGPVVDEFEERLSKTTGSCFALSCSSGTAGLHLCAAAMEIGIGDWVVVPTVTFLATANVARMTGAEVVFSDVDPDTGLMNVDHLQNAIDRAKGPVKAVFPVHLAGQTADSEGIYRLAKSYDMAVIEDACHALGTSYKSGEEIYQVGQCEHSDMAVFSFHPVKTVTMGEGGAITTNDNALRERVSRLRSHGVVRDSDDFTFFEQGFAASGEPNPWYYEMSEIGFNYRASAIHCALGNSQLGKLGKFVNQRRLLIEYYDKRLAELNSDWIRPLKRSSENYPAWHLCVILIDFEKFNLDRASVMMLLREGKIGSQVHYIPVHRQPYYLNRYGSLELPGAEEYYRRCLSLPLHPGMTEEDVDTVVEKLCDILRL